MRRTLKGADTRTPSTRAIGSPHRSSKSEGASRMFEESENPIQGYAIATGANAKALCSALKSILETINAGVMTVDDAIRACEELDRENAETSKVKEIAEPSSNENKPIKETQEEEYLDLFDYVEEKSEQNEDSVPRGTKGVEDVHNTATSPDSPLPQCIEGCGDCNKADEGQETPCVGGEGT